MSTSPTPSKGAMLAAMAILQSDGLFPKTWQGETLAQWVMRNHSALAHIIDKETHCQELAASLQKMTSWAWALHRAHGLLSNGPCANDCREAQSLLAKINHE